MEVSLIVAVILLGAVLFWILRARRKEAHHLDDVHITSKPEQKPPSE